MSLQHRPSALLLDFGGVIFELRKRAEGATEVAEHIRDRLSRAGHEYPLEELRAGFLAAQVALKYWKHSSSRRPAPVELSHREIVGDFIAAELDRGARGLLMDEATPLLETIAMTTAERVMRPGVPDLLEFCRREGIALGVVSNAHAGGYHRRLLEENSLAGYFGVQVYSDEVGIRKPNPRMIHIAAEALGVQVADAWFVGDTQDRDVAAGRRAGVGAMLLVRSKRTDHPPFPVPHTPDIILDDPRGVLAALRAASPPG